MRNFIKYLTIVILCFAVGISGYMLFNTNNRLNEISAYAEQDDLENSDTTNEEIPHLENVSGFGCDISISGLDRESGYSSDYLTKGCRNWQVMPLYAPFYRYYIDMESLSGLTESEQQHFVNVVKEAAEIWNSVVMYDSTGTLVRLIETQPSSEYSSGTNTCPIIYDPNLPSDVDGQFNPVSLFHSIKIKNFSNNSVILHEMGHLLGLQDLDMQGISHNVLMGYGSGSDHMHYQDIQGVAVANGKHTEHNFLRYAQDGEEYKHFCFYCDIMCTATEPLEDSLHFEEAETCVHDYRLMVSAGERHWLKCKKCYKVVESEYFLNCTDEDDEISLEIVSVIDATKKEYTIPNQIGGQTVTKIGNNAFANLLIEKIYLPDTIKSIGVSAFEDCSTLISVSSLSNVEYIYQSAFENCSKLTSISSLDKVKYIGQYAFKDCRNLNFNLSPTLLEYIGKSALAGCSTLTNIIIPVSTTYIGDGAFAGCNDLQIFVALSNPYYTAVDNILYNKDKTKIISTGKIDPNITLPNTVVEIGDYAFAENDNLVKLEFEGISVIGNFAFYVCKNLEEVYFYSYSVPEMGVATFPYSSFTVYVPHSKQSLYYSLFVNYTHNIDSIPIVITFVSDDEIIGTLDTYYGATITELIEPFKTGYSFDGWYDNTDYTGNIYTNGGIWDSVTDLTVYAKWSPRQFYITFSGYGSESLEDKLVTYDEPIGELPTLSKTGHSFQGWKDEYNVYYNENTIWNRTSNLTLTSDFKANDYVITYDGNGGSVSRDSQAVVYGNVINSLATANKAGYTFVGWNTQADGTGETIVAPFTYNLTDDLNLYAQYIANKYSATFDKQGGSGGVNGVDVVYNSAMPVGAEITAPTRAGYTFQGYYSAQKGAGDKYYNADMTSAHVWDFVKDTKLYAYWIGNTYNVTLDDSNLPGFGETLTSTSSSDIKYIYFAPAQSGTITLWTTHTSGDPYLYLYVHNENLSLISSNNDGNGNLDSKITYNVAARTIYAIGFRTYASTPTTGTVYIKYNTSRLIYPIYGEEMPVTGLSVPVARGYTFCGYYSERNGEGTKYYNADMTSSNEWNIAATTTLYAYWARNEYHIVFDKHGGSNGSDSVKAAYLSPMPSATPPSSDAHIFKGYYSAANDGGTKYYNENMSSASVWDLASDTTLHAHWEGKKYTVTLDNGDYGELVNVTVTYDAPMPTDGIIAPTRKGYTFKGYYSEEDGYGIQYYDGPNISSVREWDQTSSATLYAYWKKESYEVVLKSENKQIAVVSVGFRETLPFPNNNEDAPIRKGYEFMGYYDSDGIQYYSKKQVHEDYYEYDYGEIGGYYDKLIPKIWDKASGGVLYAQWKPLECNYTYDNIWQSNGYLESSTVKLKQGVETKIEAKTISGYIFKYFMWGNRKIETSSFIFDGELSWNRFFGKAQPDEAFFAVYEEQSCVAAGSLITLSDGRQVPVEDLTGNETLLVWNLFTGTFDTAPILFIDKDPAKMYKVINLHFSDGTKVKVISEHAFWDFDLNQYVYLREDAAQYIGHWFNKQITKPDGKLACEKVQLTNVVVQEEYTTAWSPVTYGHLCYYVNGMLSMPGGISGLFNIFDVDAQTMKYDQSAMAADIAEYGLFTYEEFAELYPVPETMFNAVCGQYLKVAIGKGLLTSEDLQLLINRYSVFFE